MSGVRVSTMSGLPPGIMDTVAIAAMMGIKSRSVTQYVANRKAPEPDGYIGRSPWWYEATVTTWIESRPGSGGHNKRSDTLSSLLHE